MNRRAFLGAFAALLAAPAATLASRSVPGFEALGARLYYTPFGELDWIEFPSLITDVRQVSRYRLLVRCVDGDYMLCHAGVAEYDWFVDKAES